MPKLSHPKITKGNAIYALLKLYGQEPDFMNEWTAIRKPYMPLLSKFAADLFTFFSDSGISPAEFYQANIDYLKDKTKIDPFPIKKFEYLAEAQPYFDGLTELAYKWKLRAPWAVVILSLLDLMDVSGTQEFPDKVDIPLEKLSSIYPWEPPLPPLEIKVPAWVFFLGGRKSIQAEINERLEEYEKEIKATGLYEYPSALDKHAKWWFEHYVHQKKYPELAKEYAETSAESIKRAVWNFKRQMDIKMK
jgi:hypothetical protein